MINRITNAFLTVVVAAVLTGLVTWVFADIWATFRIAFGGDLC